MGNNNAMFAEFAANLWENFIKPKMHEEMRSSVSFYKAQVIANAGDGTLTVQRPFDNEIDITCTNELRAIAIAGSQVIVFVFGGTASCNHVAFMMATNKSIAPSTASPVQYNITGENLTFYGMEEV